MSDTADRYNRTSGIYDLYDRPMDLLGGVRRRRQRMLASTRGEVLEIGVGTGRNLEFYPHDVHVTGIDVSTGMLQHAQEQATRATAEITLQVANVEQLPFADNCFDTVVATCVFCSVDDPVAGLREVVRVVKPEGQVLLLEHVRPDNAVLGPLFDLVSPITRRLLGFHVNRDTEDNIRAAGLQIDRERSGGIWREIYATPQP